MRKSVKRVLCAALVCSLFSTLATQQVLRLFAKGAAGTTTELSATFENVTGQFDTLALREQNFNSQVLKAKNTPAVSDIQDEQNASVVNKNALEQAWGSQPYSMYYNEKYMLPMGGYVYILDENDDKMYTKEEYCAVSRYNEDYPDDEKSSYMTSTGIKTLSLLRNARVVKYKLYDAQTDGLILDDYIYCEEEADLDDGTSTPANVELDFLPEEQRLVSNGQYRMDFEFFTDTPAANESAPKENTYSFSFTVDYEAPILENVRVRYYDYKNGTKEKQKIYLDVDVHDNHYAQAIMLCYPEKKTDSQTGEAETVLRLATEYPTPVRSAVKNGTTTVSIEITDIYEEYGKQLYLQIDDYALNGCLYHVDIAAANAAQTPDKGFELASGEAELTLGIYETHKVALKNLGNANLSNYVWSSGDPTIADVRNGEIVGLKAGKTTIFVSDPDKDPKKVRQIRVTVTGEQTGSLVSVPILSFGVIKTSTYALHKATGVVSVNAGQEIKLSIETDPWYHPMTNLSLKWSSTDESVAIVDQNGVITTLKKGAAIICATVFRGGVETHYSASVTLRVEEFNVSNFTLNDYHGVGYNEGNVADGTDILVIPTDMNIKYIGEDAFKGNENVRRIVIPASVVEIHENAFENCKALEEVYFVSEKHRQTAGAADDTSIDFSELSFVHRRAFYNCKSLKKVDFSNVKTITLDQEVFLNCEKLIEIVDMPSVGTAYHRAFKNCTSLASVDLSGLHVSGENVFENCVLLHTVTTDMFTAIGKDMFVGCKGLQEITLRTAKIGAGAFGGCVNLKGVTFEVSEIEIGAGAFENCGTGLERGLEINFNEKAVRSIGNGAFKGAKLATENETFTLPNGLVSIGEKVFEDCQTVKTVAIGNTDLDGAKLQGAAFKGLNVTVVNSTKFAEENGVIYALENGVKNKIVYVNNNASSGNVGQLDLSALNIVEIGEYAFAGVEGITEVILPESLAVIGEGAFAGSSILKIRFNGAAITEIPARAFAGGKIENIELPVSVSKIGDSAFVASALKSVVTENESALVGIVNVGDYAFATCSLLTEISFKSSLTEIGNYAFFGAKTLSNANLENVVKIGDYAFYDTALTALDLPSAKSVGTFAFAASGKAKYASLSIPAVETIGAFAFFEGAQNSVALPQSVKEIGSGAFASSKDLTAITFIDVNGKTVTENGSFFVDNGVLYQYLNEEKTKFAVLCYPGALLGAAPDGTTKKQYKIKDGTVRVEAYSFYGLKEGALDAIVIPYSMKVLGNAAFFASGIKEYTFASIQAPLLETVYRADVAAAIEASAKASSLGFYKGYYYSNFQTNIYNYTHYVGGKSDLTINYPTNGKGYDTHIYRLYFGTKKESGVMMTDDTRACLRLISTLTGADEVKKWLDWNAADTDKKAIVEAFSQQVKAARASYNNLLKDEGQAAIFDKQYGVKLLAIEEQLRAVKEHFNIPVYVDTIAVAKTSAHKATYTEGEKFDWTGLVITITYDDGSTTELTPESGLLTLKDEGVALMPYHSYVMVEYTENGKTESAYVVITVNERKLSLIEQYPEEANVMRNVLIYGGASMVLVGGLGLFVMLAINKRKLVKVAMTVSTVDPFDLGEINQQSKTEEKRVEIATADGEEPQE